MFISHSAVWWTSLATVLVPFSAQSTTGNTSPDHGKLYSISGKTFELLCGHGNPHTGFTTHVSVASLEACAELCANDARCGSAEYHASKMTCELEPDNNPMPYPTLNLRVPKMCPSTPSPPGRRCISPDHHGSHLSDDVSFDVCSATNNCKLYGLGGGYSTVHKPGVHHLYATDPPTVTVNHFDKKRCSTECPEADGQLFASPTDENFVMSCKKRHGTTYLKQVPDRYPSFASCMKACGGIPACLSVDYEVKTQKCFFSTNSKMPTIAAAAFMSAHSPDHGKPITVNGVDFYIACQHGINSHPYTGPVAVADYFGCVESCAASASCGGASWIGGDTCYHHPDSPADGSAASVDQRLDSDAFVKVPGNLFNTLIVPN
ncbi:hypothetical protein PG994_002781 [Apiospora phragmitis]|uniref:Apple domain-containing protein n=1 Tax=Apiospora phragmitis TaxID=2905665 RepID=A0ABR1W645_9PEZI